MGWDRPDPHRLRRLPGVLAARHGRKLDDDGVTFRSVYDGTPRAPDAGAGDGDPGGARLRHRDGASTSARPATRRAASSSAPSSAPRLGRALRRAPPAAPGQLALRDRAGRRRPRPAPASAPSDRRRSASTATPSAGCRWARSARRRSRSPAATAALLPADQPRYFMGIGDPEGLLRVFARGRRHVRLRAAHPARRGRARALTWEGRLNLRNARFARDPARSTRTATAPPAAASRARTSATS